MMKAIQRWRSILAGAAALALVGTAAPGCVEPDVTEPQGNTLDLREARHAEEEALQTYIDRNIEIDELEGGPGDANLFSLANAEAGDPADGSAHALLPFDAERSFVDWNELGLDAEGLYNHRVTDDFKRDATAFPRKNECVGEAMVLSKQDLTYIASANNRDFAYFAVQRADNNGDSAYYWLFTRERPHLDAGVAPCRDIERRLTYDLTGTGELGTSDVLLVGQFSPSSGALVRVFQAVTTKAGVPATDAINYEDGTLWVERLDLATRAAVNTTVTDPGTFGNAGVQGVDEAGNLLPEIFAEAAVPLSVFTGEAACGATFYATVITRPSGSGGTSPDLKDLAGPALFNFGSPEATAVTRATCGLELLYDVTSVTGIGDEPLSPEEYTCRWTFTNLETGVELTDHPTACSGVQAVPEAGLYEASVDVSLTAWEGCGFSDAADPVSLYAPLVAEAHAQATCEQPADDAFEALFRYHGAVYGGGPELAYAWAFTGCDTCALQPVAAAELPTAQDPGTVMVFPGDALYKASLEVTDLRAEVFDLEGNLTTCAATASDTARPYAPLKVHLGLRSEAPACSAMVSDAVTWDAYASGGDGNFTYSWSGYECGAGALCTVDPANDDFCPTASLQVTVDDGTDLCAPVASEVETYTKQTIVTASDNPAL